MKTAGIVAEYNPFHKGHLYHIRKTRERAEVEAIIAVISSHFMQRGAPAIAGKGLRTAMALAQGVDLVLELPVVYSCHNAGLFANAAVDILAATGLVDCLSFGMETPDVTALEALADILNREPPAFRAALRRFLDAGYSFVQARSLALDEILPGALALLKRPNNNLALAYVKRIRERGYAIAAEAVERVGAGYHDRTVEAGELASATAIRALLVAGAWEAASAVMPEESFRLLKIAAESGHLAVDPDLYWRAVKAVFLRASATELGEIAEMREGLENRLLEEIYRADSLDGFVDACTSRRYPAGRIRRYCAHLLLNLRHMESRNFQERGPAYIRVLGANRVGRALLKRMRKSATLRVIARSSAPWDSYAGEMMRFEHRAGELWELLTARPRAHAEAEFVPLMTE